MKNDYRKVYMEMKFDEEKKEETTNGLVNIQPV